MGVRMNRQDPMRAFFDNLSKSGHKTRFTQSISLHKNNKKKVG